ncbi:Ig-like domain-containing protein, partial [Vibrio sp. ZSDZ65]
MFNKNTLYITLISILTSIILAACGGESGGSSSAPAARKSGTIFGTVFDAPVYGASVSVWEYENEQIGRQLGLSHTDAFGNYSIQVVSSSRPLLVRAEGGSYTDPLTKEIISVSNGKILKLDSVINYSEGLSQSLMITPLTNITAGLAKYKQSKGASTENAINGALDTVNSMYGFDVNRTEPIDITNGGQSSFATPGHKYGALLTAYSSYSNDLIEKYGNSSNVYTSMNLADIQYRDIVSDGYLDGKEILETGGGVTPISFGRREVSSDVYTNHLAQHLLIVVNDPTLNISGTKASDYQSFSNKVNELGTQGDELSMIPPRNKIDIDTEAPVVTRTDSDVLSGIDIVDIKLTDEIGVQDVSVYLQFELNGSWSDEYRCNESDTTSNYFCAVNYSAFEKGKRETSVKVMVNTVEVDEIDTDSDTGFSNVTAARIVLYPTDVLGNTLVQGTPIDFIWDNKAPVIDVTSSSTVNNKLTDYVLKGIIKEDYQDIESSSVSFNGGITEDLECTPVISESGSACKFEKSYKTEEFSSSTLFEITATDTQGNVGIFLHTVSKDDQSPTQIVTYPQTTPMTFVNVSDEGERITSDAPYTRDTYTANNVASSKDYLKIDFLYASSGIKAMFNNEADFENFNVNLLKQNKIPYLKVIVSDPQNETIIGSSADKLKLIVEYSVSQNNDGNYVLQHTTDTVASSGEYSAEIPHETINYINDRASQVTYYIPYVKEILGDNFRNVAESSAQRLVIKTMDESENTSVVEEVYFRSSFDLPTISVVTPFIGAQVQLEGLTENGDFTSLGNCTSSQTNEPNSGQKAWDVATCPTTTDLVNYDFMRIRVLSSAGSNQPYYYQWEDHSGSKTYVDLTKANIGAYFKLNGSQTFYITELATYHTGLFDFLWNKVVAGEKTAVKGLEILQQVQSALAGRNSHSFFGFDPTLISYATNEMLRLEAVPEPPTNEYLHRFLLEAINELSSKTPRNSSVGFASSMYDDFSYDGKANGIGANGNQINLDGYDFGSHTYRRDLAQALYNVMTINYGVATHIAQLYADEISTANPTLDGEAIIEGDGESIDNLPPEPTVEIETGDVVTANNKDYITGEITAKINLKDASGIDETPEYKPSFSTMWFKVEQDSIPTPLEVEIVEDIESSDKYQKNYRFSLDTQSSSLPDIVEFAIEISAKDRHGNAYGYDGSEPYVKSYYIDNDYPNISYLPPKDVTGNTLSEEVYLNASNVHELTFIVEDLVGDKLSERQLVFSLPDGKKVPYDPSKFTVNTASGFKVKLCTGTSCSDQGTTIDPGNGDWTVGVRAEDNLGNVVSELTSTAPKFKVRIDSIAPIVKGEDLANRLGGNSIWKPNIDWGTLSKGDHVNIDLRRGSGQTMTLTSCEPEDELCKEQPHIIGTQPEVQVQLVANAFEFDALNQFYITATDSAYPANVSNTGTITFKVDNQGPKIELNTPWATPCVSDECFVLGEAFDVRFKSVIDESGVRDILLYQVGESEPIKSFLPSDTNSEFVIPLTKADTSKIRIVEEGEITEIYAQAIDIHGFTSNSNTRSFILDRTGPLLGLNGYSSDAFYLSNYQFNITAQDFNANGVPSIDGVDKESIKFWSFTDTPPLPGVPGQKPDENLTVELTGLSDGINNIRIEALDLRGNKTTQDFPIQIRNAKPQISSVQFSYENGDPIEGAITRDESIVISMEVEDPSGIEDVVATYKHSEQSSSNPLTFNRGEGNRWFTTLLPTQLSDDGTYAFAIKVYNKVRYINEADRRYGELNKYISVQRQGVELSIAEPLNFQNHIAGKVLTVNFDVVGEVKAKTLECWIREDYTSEDAPSDDELFAYSGVINVSQNKHSCTVISDRNMSKAPVALITRVLGTNGKVSIDKYNFSMADIDAPIVMDGEAYYLKGNDVWFDDESNKMLTFDLTFYDELSGVNTSTDDVYPKLVKKQQGNRAFVPKSCSGGEGEIKCTYSELYSSIISGLSTKQEYSIKNLSDIAGNVTAEHDLLLQMPQGDIDVDIISPETSSTINGQQLVVQFRVKIYENSRLDNVTARFGVETYNYKEHPEKFSQFEDCIDDPTYKCSTFTSDLPDGSDGKSLTAKIIATDVWAKSGEQSVTVYVDNTPPKIGQSVSVTTPDPLTNMVRFRFDITDAVSGLEKVKYSLFKPRYEEEKLQDDDGSATYFELNKDDLINLNTISVDITATDKVGLQSNERIEVNIKVPEISLSFESGAEIIDGKLIFKKESQAFTLDSIEGDKVNAQQYTLDYESIELDNLKKTGQFSQSSVNDTINFTADEQGLYQIKLGVIDSIGREITNFELNGKKYDSQGLQAIVDYQKPQISNLTGTQLSMTPENGRYRFQVMAMVSDKNLNLVTSNAIDGQAVEFTPESITKPENANEPHTLEYLLSPGGYAVTIVADDLAGHEVRNSINIVVKEATVPTLNIIPIGDNPLAGGKELDVKFIFSEEVVNFDVGDIKIVASDNGEKGSLVENSLTSSDNITWIAKYKSPENKNKNITVTVDDDSYESINTIPGKGASAVIEVKGVLPTLSKATFNPTHQAIGESVEVTLTFDSEMESATATLGGQPISTLAATAERT